MILPSESSKKPLGCGPASTSDWNASTYLSTKLDNIIEGMDIDDAYVNQTNGSIIGDSGDAIITFGGPCVNPVVKYLESELAPEYDRAPLRYINQGDLIQFKHRTIGQLVSTTQTELEGGLDYFIIENMVDGHGRFIMICYGFTWRGTLAAGKYFEKVIYPDLQLFNNSWLLVRWQDTNQNDFVDAPEDGDTYTIIPRG
jgi:hypothetical protein